MSGANGILLVDKPAGWTSHDIVAKVRRLFGQKRVGHTGTLDPMATGLLVVCLGQATRVVEYMVGHSKVYLGTITLGRTTDTDDAEGTTLAEAPVPPGVEAMLPGVITEFTGHIEQLPPAYSAIKIGGQKAYEYARRGEALDLAKRQVAIHRLDFAFEPPDRIHIEVACSAGTYIRSLARDIGAALGCGGHLSALRRTRAGLFDVDDAVTIDALTAMAEVGRQAECLLPVDEGLGDMPAAILTLAHATPLRNGLRHRVDAEPAGPIRVYDDGGTLVGIGSITANHLLHCAKVLHTG